MIFPITHFVNSVLISVFYKTALHIACLNEDIATVRFLLARPDIEVNLRHVSNQFDFLMKFYIIIYLWNFNILFIKLS